MADWQDPPSTHPTNPQTWDIGGGDGNAAWKGDGDNKNTSDDGFGGQANDDGFAQGGENGSGEGCRNCGQDGHFARECPEPRKMGACFNCGEEGHSKSECTAPRKFKGECRACGQEGHMQSDCPTRVDQCKNCLQEGHTAMTCKNPKVLDNHRVAEKSQNEAWDLLKQASDERDIADFKEGVQILSKAAPDYTYPGLDVEFRKRGYNIYLIAMEKDHGDTWTNVNLQGEVGKKFAVSYFTSDKPQRPTLVDKWPTSTEDNLARLDDAGVPLDRGVDKCTNCDSIGHKSRACEQEKMTNEASAVSCYLCGESGHRVRDCTQERRKGRACKICESEDHIAKDCPDREKQACRNCGSEDHFAKECPTREKRTCRNCGDEDHFAKECPMPRKQTCRICDAEDHLARDCPKQGEPGMRPKTDWTKVTCSVCNQLGHGRARCPQAANRDAGRGGTKEVGSNGGGEVGTDWTNDNPGGGSAPAAWEGGDMPGSGAGASGW